MGTNTINFHFMLQHMEPMCCRNLHLEIFKLIVLKLDDPVTFSAYHMVMMLTYMPVLVSNDTVVKPVLVGKTIPTHEVKGIGNKGGGQISIFFFYDFK